jgi:aerobic-type carbon monoxide dehydrogenase small subunit (CoxS/CutS family)
MLMSCAALLRKGGPIDAERVRHAISGNLCRCGTYPSVVAAVLEVAGGRKDG